MPTFGAVQFEFLLWGATWTLALSAIACLGGGLLGFAVAMARISPVAALRWVSAAYVQVVQGTPLLVLLFVFYFGFDVVGISGVPALVAAGAGLVVYASAYFGEIWRGAIQSVPRTQWEAAECLALTRRARMARVILPQALRIATAPTVGFTVQVIKNTSLASVVGFVELAQAGKIVNNSTFQPFLVFVLVGLIYFAICYPLSAWSRTLERTLDVGRR